MTRGLRDTIVARATPQGVAALAVIRMSGPNSVEIVSSVFGPRDLGSRTETHRAYVGYITNSAGHDIDQVIVTVFLAPSSVTGEDVIEITCHGGELAPALILNTLIEAGARPAKAGEFTERAFLNGKIDLAQAESVAELIHATSRRSQQVSLQLLKGGYSALLTAFRDSLVDLCAHIELELDFSEEDVEFADKDRLRTVLTDALGYIDRLLGSYRYGALVRSGIRIAINGLPNAGKSTLLNALVGHDRAIVSPEAGTTRDQVSADLDFDGIRLSITDTAGLRGTDDPVESEGVRRAELSAEEADIILYVYDVRNGLLEEEEIRLERWRSSFPEVHIVIIANKSDLVPGSPESPGKDDREMGCHPSSSSVFTLSARDAISDEHLVEPLLTRIVDVASGDERRNDWSEVVTLERHRDHLIGARKALSNAENALNAGLSGDLLAQDLRIAMDEIGAITGATANEDILNRIFSSFCIGK